MQFTKLTQSRLITLCKFSAAASLAGVGGWQFWTGKCYFEPFGPENDALFQSEYFKKFNPGNHPSLNDSCVRKVPVSQIPPDLVEDALRGGSKLTERFCAGVWGGYGYSIQRNILALVGQNEGNAKSMLWDKNQLLSSTYEEGTIVTDHFKVVAKNPRSIIMWGAESPSTNPELRREMENLSEVSTNVDTDKGVVEFRLKNIFYNGVERLTGDLFPPPIVWLHFQYCKLLVEAGQLLIVEEDV
ncbi:O-methyltransferase family protein [Aspergillus niger]|uniref:Contig An02c0010, genomic contig n=3 Tax=Aspergillus niger TaxID=5061 RepID=A2QBS6_ASPNC|nr:uncharacterized protein An02g01070 [Aspergillus niger]XP_025460245.1 uncharacterized protein BO96DRAFT_417717 [Aspergillus niger CBS 101883]RDH25020.1 hypothetical protein M747DRAFT_327678 [Aspergillus niger ATCC 13496]PYH62190.1 hypothetical protein BO96DRAFT_417717 [Aspergillus niger CBS 101883]CAK96323.1 unnamed protein product [Aspergillus niger]GJP90949.1 O-methyltransferase family protein [Aspergillus niger]